MSIFNALAGGLAKTTGFSGVPGSLFNALSGAMNGTTVQKVQQTFHDYFEPDKSGKVRLRDVVSNIPSGIEEGFLKPADKFVGKPTLRGAGSVISLLDGRGSYTPQGVFEKTLFGEDTMSVTRLGKETLLQDPEKESGPLANLGYGALGLVVGSADAIPAGRGAKTSLKFSAETISKILKSTHKGKILKALKSDFPDLPEGAVQEAANKLRNVTDEKTFGKVVDKSFPELQRGFAKSAQEALDVPDDVRKKLDAISYSPITNKDTIRKAIKLIDSDPDKAYKLARDTSIPGTADINTISQILIKRAEKAGNWNEVVDLVDVTAKRATTQGQALQALAMFSKLSPDGVLRYTQSFINKANREKTLLGFKTSKQIKLSASKAEEITELAKKVEKMEDGTKEKIIETAKLRSMIAGTVPASIGKKIDTAQTLAQLLNPKTIIRNIGGNFGFAGGENLSDVLSVPLDIATSVITGKRSKVLPSLSKQAKGFGTGLVEGVEDALWGVDRSGLKSQYDVPLTPVFEGKVGRAAEKALGVVLRGPDRAFYRAAYDGSIHNQVLAHNKTLRLNGAPTKIVSHQVDTKYRGSVIKKTRELVDPLREPTEKMKEVAHYDGLYRTFQDDSALAKTFQGIKTALNAGQDFGIGNFVLKYPKTPANLINRGLAYSPAGFAKIVVEAAKPLIGREFNQKAFVESFSRAITGTTTQVGTGALLHRLGIMSGKYEKDSDLRGVQDTTGLGSYKINASGLKRFVLSGMDPEVAKFQKGDAVYSYDWFQPFAVGLSVGANIDESAQVQAKSGVVPNGAMKVLDATLAGGDTILEQPLLKGIKDVLGARDAETAANSIIRGAPQSFVPTILKQINDLNDNTSRETYDKNIAWEAYNSVVRKIPGASKTINPRITVFGDDQETYDDGSNTIFNVMFNPAFRSTYNPTPEAEMVLDLYQETGEKTQAPRKIGKRVTVNGEKVKLGPNTRNKLQRFVGQVTKQEFNALAQNREFNVLSAEEKVKYLSGLLSDIGTAGKMILLGHRTKKKPGRGVQQILNQFSATPQQIQEVMTNPGDQL